MKLALVLLMSAVGFGQQAKPAEKPQCREWTCGGPSGKCTEWPADCPARAPKKPHKPKPSVKTSVGDLDTGPVEMLKPDGCDVAADECWVFKPALAESSITSGIIHTFEMNRFQAEGRESFICPQGDAVCFLAHVADSPPASQIDSAAGSVVKLSDSEYSHLQQLRASVVEEEKRLAAKYGVYLQPYHPCPPDCLSTGMPERHSDHYEFHGQFLIIDKGGK